MHASESFGEVAASRARYGVSDVERMAKLEALGPNMVLIHMGWASPKEIALSMKHDLKISCTPSTGYRLGLASMEFGKAQRLDPSIMPPETVIEMATLNGAKAALWSDEIGSLEAGKKADIAIFDTRKPEWQPVLNPLANLVYSARGGADTVICNGRILMENNVVLSIDEKRAFAEAKQRGERIATDSGLWDLIKPKWPML